MIYKLRRTDDLDIVRELHSLAFPEDKWVGDDHTFWVATDEHDKPVGFCSAIYWPDRNAVFLSRAAVAQSAQGNGLQRRMVRTRLNWARQQGAQRVVTYTTGRNYGSIINLLRCGLRFYEPEDRWAGNDKHYFQLYLQQPT